MSSVFNSFKSIIFDVPDEVKEGLRQIGKEAPTSYEERREEALTRLYKGVDVRNRRYRFKKYKRCFVGSEAVDFMVESGWAKSREDAVTLGQSLQKEFNLFEHVVEPEKHKFKDDYLYFKFNTNLDASGADEESSTEEDPSEKGSSEGATSRRSKYLTRSLYGDNMKIGLTAVGQILKRGVTQKYNFKYDKEGFYADEAVDYMVNTGLASSRDDAESIGLALQGAARMIENASSIDEPFRDAKMFFYFPEDAEASSELFLETWKEEMDEACTFFRKNIKVVDHVYHLRTYKETFTGKEAVDLFLMAGITTSRQDAVFLGRALMVEHNLFVHVTNEHEFEDSELFYKLLK